MQAIADVHFKHISIIYMETCFPGSAQNASTSSEGFSLLPGEGEGPLIPLAVVYPSFPLGSVQPFNLCCNTLCPSHSPVAHTVAEQKQPLAQHPLLLQSIWRGQAKYSPCCREPSWGKVLAVLHEFALLLMAETQSIGTSWLCGMG